MKHMILVLAGLCGLAGASALAETVPLLSCDGFPCVELRVEGGKSAKFAIDTGDVTSTIALDQAKAMGLAVTPYIGKDGKPVADYQVASLKDVRVGAETLGDIKVLVTDLTDEHAKGLYKEIQGTLAYPAFKDRRLVLDFRRHQLDLSDPGVEVPCPATCSAMTYPTFGEKGPPIVAAAGFQVNGKPIIVQIDSLYAGSLLIYEASIEKLDLKAAASSAQKQEFPYTDGGVEMIEGRAAREGFEAIPLLTEAPIFFPTPGVHQPDGLFDGTVGVALFQNHAVGFDFHQNRVWVD